VAYRLVLAFKSVEPLKFFVPFALQVSGDHSIVWVNSLVAPLRESRLVGEEEGAGRVVVAGSAWCGLELLRSSRCGSRPTLPRGWTRRGARTA
jgi:hypothetical protein